MKLTPFLSQAKRRLAGLTLNACALAAMLFARSVAAAVYDVDLASPQFTLYRDPNTGNARITIGYLDGAFQNDPNIGSFNDPAFGGPALATNQVLFRPCLMGDLNLDGVVNGDDIGLIIGLGYYGKPSAPHMDIGRWRNSTHAA